MFKFVVMIALAMQAGAAFAGEVMESSYVLRDGQRVLRHEVLGDGRAEDVWKALPADGNSEVVSFLPDQMRSTRLVSTPPDVPHPQLAKKLFTVIELVRIEDPSTARVRVSMLPYGMGAEWDAVYKHFRALNADMLRRLEEKYRE